MAQQNTGQRDRPVWLVVLRPRWLAWHAFAVVAFIGMIYLGLWQFHRAESGNELSWAYTFEWPLFAVAGAYFWVKTLREELHLHRTGAGAPAAQPATAEGALPEAAGGAAAEGSAAAHDPVAEQAAAEAYAERLKAEVTRHGKWHGWR